jgi:hypothetical protein
MPCCVLQLSGGRSAPKKKAGTVAGTIKAKAIAQKSVAQKSGTGITIPNPFSSMSD